MRYGLVDEAGLVNINTADPSQLAALGILDDSQIDSILDWIDTDDEIRPGGAEAGYYNHLPFPYEIRNGRLRTLEELRLIKGIDDETFYGEDTNLNGVLDRNEDDGDASPPHDNADGVLQLGLAGLCTVYSYQQNTDAEGQARVNLNQAGRRTLVEQLNFTNALVDAVDAAAPPKPPQRDGPGGSARSNRYDLQYLRRLVLWIEQSGAVGRIRFGVLRGLRPDGPEPDGSRSRRPGPRRPASGRSGPVGPGPDKPGPDESGPDESGPNRSTPGVCGPTSGPGRHGQPDHASLDGRSYGPGHGHEPPDPPRPDQREYREQGCAPDAALALGGVGRRHRGAADLGQGRLRVGRTVAGRPADGAGIPGRGRAMHGAVQRVRGPRRPA